MKENKQICLHCYETIKQKGVPSVQLLEDIFELFYLIKEPVSIKDCKFTHGVLEYLERNKYIITTEFPDPSDTNEDIILAIPKGCFKVQDNDYFFCFDNNNHN